MISLPLFLFFTPSYRGITLATVNNVSTARRAILQYKMVYILLLQVVVSLVLSSVTSETLRQTSQYEKEEQYEILPSSAILDRLQKLVANYPNFATLTTTQEWFGLPRAGKLI